MTVQPEILLLSLATQMPPPSYLQVLPVMVQLRTTVALWSSSMPPPSYSERLFAMVMFSIRPLFVPDAPSTWMPPPLCSTLRSPVLEYVAVFPSMLASPSEDVRENDDL